MIKIEEDHLKHGVLGLVLAVVEILRDALRSQAARRVEAGGLSDEEVERLGRALAELDEAIEDIKREQGLDEAVQSVRDGLDDLVDGAVRQLIDPTEWADPAAGPAAGEPEPEPSEALR